MKLSSNNTNKLSPQERCACSSADCLSSNNTNKLSPQEQTIEVLKAEDVQIIQINLVLKNFCYSQYSGLQFK